MIKWLKQLSHKKLVITSVGAFLAATLLISGSFFLINARGAGEDGIAEEVTIGTKTYTKDNKLKILEIVTHEAFDEMSQLVGDDQGAVSWNDMIAACPTGQANESAINDYRSKVLDNYWHFISAITGNGSNGEYVCFKNKLNGKIVREPWSVNLGDARYDWNNIELAYCTRDSDNWDANYTEIEGGIRNIFGYLIFGHKNMEDKMEVVIKTADDVTKEDIDSATLVYLNSKNHNGNYTNAYKNYYEYLGTPVTVPNSGSVNWTLGTEYDLDAEVALYLYFQNTVEKKALIMASSDKGPGNDGKYSNISRMCLNINSIDADVFYMDFAYEKVNDRLYRGARGEVRVENENGVDVINVYLDTEEGLLPFRWSPTMYIDDTNVKGSGGKAYGYAPNGNNNSYYPAYNGTDGGNQDYLTQSTFVYNSNNSMVNDLINFDATRSDYDDNGNYRGTSYGDALMRFDLIDNGLYSPKVIEYILGATSGIVIPDGETLTLKILEIEPAGVFRYDENNVADQEIIMKWFGLNSTTYKDKIIVSIDHVSMNAFNGMTSDIRSDYDLVILGAYDINEDNSNKHEMLTDSVYTSINDITQKAYDKLIGYAKIGMPFVVDKSIYYASADAAAEDTIVHKFNTLDLTNKLIESRGVSSNVIGIDISGTNQTASRVLKYRIKPKVDVVPVDAPDYDANNPVLVTKKQLADMIFEGTVKDTTNYRVRIFVDRNCDSLFTEDYDSDGAELLYFAVENNKPVMGPRTKEGYDAVEKAEAARKAAENAADWEKEWRVQEAERLAAEAEAILEEEGRILGAEHTEEEFVLNLPLPEALNGYIGWRVEVEDTATGLVTNKNGAFAIKNDAIGKIVKVLQIIRDDGASNIDLKGDVFTDCFNDTTKITGLGLDVTVLTKSQFNDIPDKDEYLASFSMLVLGLQDNYGVTMGKITGTNISGDFSTDSINCINAYIDNGNSVLFTHDSMSYRDDNKNDAKTYDKLNAFTKAFQTKIGMQHGYTITETLKMKNNYKNYNNYNSITKTNNTRNTNRVTQLNTGEITEYPYKIENANNGSNTIPVATTHGQYFKLNLEDLKRTDDDGNVVDDDDVVVWYTLSQTNSGDKNEFTDLFSIMGQDAVNNFYVYSVGNITYSSAGHSSINQNGEEMRLFVNTFVRAILSGNSIPEVRYENAVQENVNLYSKYYRNVANVDTSVPLEFEYTVTDNDLVEGVGRLKQVYMFYDRNNNDRYDDGTDIILAYVGYENDNVSPNNIIYTSTPKYSKSLVSGITVKCNLWDVTSSAGVSRSIEQEMVNKMNENNLRIGIVASDSNGAKGFAVLKLVERELYKLQ